MGFFARVLGDATSLAKAMTPDHEISPRIIAQTLAFDGFTVLALTRLRQTASRWRVPFANRTLRTAQMVFYGIEISKDATLGEGVSFLHTNGVVIGGDSRIGARTLFLGSITIGNVNNRGYPTIGEDVVIGAGARILGPVHIGDGAVIGANAVVVRDVPAGATAVGIPAVVREPKRRADASRAPSDD